MTNVDELFDVLINIGQHPKQKSDTVTVLEKIGHFLDVENQTRFDALKAEGLDNRSISEKIADTLDLEASLGLQPLILTEGNVWFTWSWRCFCFKDPNGIRPAYWYEDDEVVVAASERPVIQTAFNANAEDVVEVSQARAYH